MKDSGSRLSKIIIEHITEMIAIVDKKGIITYANSPILHLFDIPLEDIQGKNFFDYIDTTDLSRVKKEFNTLIKNTGSSSTISHGFIQPSEKRLFVESTFRNLIDDQDIQGIFLSIRDITDTKRIEQQLFQTKKELQKAIDNENFISDNTLDVIFQVKLTGEYTYINPASKRIAGYDPKEMIGRKWMEYVPKKELIKYLACIKKLLTGEPIDDFQTFVIHKDGHLVPVEFSGKVVKKDKETYINGIMRDLSNRIDTTKQLENLAESLEEQVNERKKELESLYGKLREQEEMYETLFMELPDGATLSNERLQSILKINKKMASNLGKTPKELIGKKWKEILPESLYQERLQYAMKALETNTVQSNSDKRGELYFQSYYVPLTLHNGKKYIFGIAQDITALKKQELLIRDSEEKYRTLFEHANEGIAVAQDGYLRLVNAKLIQMIGRSEEEIYQTPFIELIHPEDRELVASRYQQRLAGDQPPEMYEFRVIDPSGSVRWARINAILFSWNGKPATLNFIMDITDRKLAEESLKESEQQFRAIAVSAQDAIMMVDDAGRIVLWNQAAERIFGYVAEEIIGQSYRLLISLENKKEFLRTLEQCIRMGQGPLFGTIHEIPALSKKGVSFPVELSLSSVLLKGKWHTVAIARDISERKKMEKSLLHAYEELEQRVEERTADLQESEKRYRDLFEFAPVGIGIVDEKGHIIDGNQHIIRLMGYSHLREIKKINVSDIYVHKSDRKRLLAEIKVSGKVRDWLVQLKRKDGEIYNALLDIDVRYIDNKKTLFTTMRDITELLHTQQQIAETRDFLENIINGASEFIMTLKVDLTISMWNKTAVDLTGYKRKEVIGRSIKACKCFENASAIVDHIKNIQEGRVSILEDIILHPKTAGKRILALSSSIIHGDKKSIIGFLFVGRDITSQSTLHGKLLQGNSYLLLDDSVYQALDMFINLQMSGYHGLLFSRGNPVSLKGLMASLQAEMFFFGERPLPDVQTLTSLDEVYGQIQNFVQLHDPSVVLLDRLDYLMTIHSYEEVLKLIYKVNSLISSHHVILLIRMNESLLSEKDRTLLQQEVQMLPVQKVDTIKLDEALYNILVFVNEQNQKNISVSFQKVGRQFSISKVTTQKRIYDLERSGLIGIKITGRTKLVHITKEGELLLHQRTAV